MARGAKVITGGKRADLSGDEAKGNFYEPTVITGATVDMKVRVQRMCLEG